MYVWLILKTINLYLMKLAPISIDDHADYWVKSPIVMKNFTTVIDAVT